MGDRWDLEVRDDPEHHRFVLEGTTAGELDYALEPGRIVLIHTGVPPELRGHGLGGRLVETAVDFAAAQRLVVVPLCPFAARWLRQNPEVAETVAVDWSGTDQEGRSIRS